MADREPPERAHEDDTEVGQRQPRRAGSFVRQTTIDADLLDRATRIANGWDPPDGPGRVMVEINLLYRGGARAAETRFSEVFREAFGGEDETPRPPFKIANTYFRCTLTIEQVHRLVSHDQGPPGNSTTARVPEDRSIYHVWLDYLVTPLLDRSVSTVKADAAQRSFAASGAGVTWAVVDSGIRAAHPHFAFYGNLDAQAADGGALSAAGDLFQYHADFTVDPAAPAADEKGTPVAEGA